MSPIFAKPFRLLVAQAALLPLLLGVFDFVVRSVHPGVVGARLRFGYYALALGSSWCFAAAVLFAAATRRARGWRASLPIAAPAALIYGLTLFCNVYVFEWFGEYIFPSAAEFVLRDPVIIADYIRTYGGPRAAAGFVALLAIALPIFVPWRAGAPLSGRQSFAAIALSVTLAIVSLKVLDKQSGLALPPDSATWVSLSKYALKVKKKLRSLHPAQRLPVVQAPCAAPAPKTIVVVVNESMGVRSIDWLGSTTTGTPKLSARLKQAPQRFIPYQRAFTAASVTVLSLSSIYTGVLPGEAYERKHKLPMLWDLAKAAGYRTAYVTSQRLHWAGLSDFLLNEPIDLKASSETLPATVVNDTGVDDQVALAEVRKLIRDTPAAQPLFIFYNTNALHAPFQETSELVDMKGAPKGERYERALYLVDTALDGLFGALEQSGRLDDTLLLSTADHGEPSDPSRGVQRSSSFYDEIIRVPMFVWLPRAWLGTPVADAVRANADVPVSNIDIVPTVARAVCRAPQSDAYSGVPLTEPAPRNRVLVVLNSNETHQWTHEGFGLVREQHRFACHDSVGCQIFDTATDPGERKDVWDAPELAAPKQQFLDYIAGNGELTKIWQYFGHGENVEGRH